MGQVGSVSNGILVQGPIVTIFKIGITYGIWRHEGISCEAWGLESLAGWVGLGKLTVLGDSDTYLMAGMLSCTRP